MAPVEPLIDRLLTFVCNSPELISDALSLLINMTFQATSAVDAILGVPGAIQMLVDKTAAADASILKDL
jgi:hypothetical protein